VAVKSFTIILLLSFVFSVKGQITVEQHQEKEMLFIYKKQDEGKVLLDSITTLKIFQEYSYAIDSNKIYVSWSGVAEDGKVFYMNLYELKGDSLNISGQYWIEESKYEKLFKKGIKVSFRKDGMNISFEKGDVSLFVLSYSNLNLEKISIPLKKLSKF